MMALSKNPGYQDLDEFPWVKKVKKKKKKDLKKAANI